jgi:hypothetical protein
MKQFDNIIAKFERLSVEAETRKVIEYPQIRKSIKDMNRDTLYKKGERTTGGKIRTYKAAPGQVYADRTIGHKAMTGQPYNRVTLKETGAFYRSFKVIVEPSHFAVNARFGKGMPLLRDKGGRFKKNSNENISDNLDIEDVLGLNKKSLGILSKQIKPKVLKNVRAAILQNNR